MKGEFAHRAVFAAVGLTLLLAGCATPTPTPLQALQHSYEVMQGVESFRATGDFTITAESEDFSLSLGMDFDMEVVQPSDMHMMLTMNLLEQEQTFEVISTQGAVFMRLPEEEWRELSAEEAEALFGRSLSPSGFNFFQSLFPAEEVPWELYTVTSLGQEEVDGVPAEHLSIQVDFPALWDKLSEEQKERLFSTSTSGMSQEQLEELISKTEIKKLETWIDGDGFQRLTELEIDFGEMFSLASEMQMFDFNQEIVIEKPI